MSGFWQQPWTTLRVIGDVHGQTGQLAQAVASASPETAFLLLGDITDRGPDSLGAMRLVMELAETERAIMVPGNHDDKLCRWATGKEVQVGAGLAATIAEIEAAGSAGNELVQRFADWVGQLPLWQHTPKVAFAHGSWAPEMANFPEVTLAKAKGKQLGKLKALALYGVVDGKTPAGYPRRTYGWADNIPAGLTVCIGHDPVPAVTKRTGALGGHVIQLDTGASTGGVLSWMDFSRHDLGL